VRASWLLELKLRHQGSLTGTGQTNWGFSGQAVGAGCGLGWPRWFKWCSAWAPCCGLHYLLLSFTFLLMARWQVVKTGLPNADWIGAQLCYLYCLDSVV